MNDHYRVTDSFWFIRVAERFGQPLAEAVNEQVWGRVGSLAVKDLVGRFNVQEKRLAGFIEALRLYPWGIMTCNQ